MPGKMANNVSSSAEPAGQDTDMKKARLKKAQCEEAMNRSQGFFACLVGGRKRPRSCSVREMF